MDDGAAFQARVSELVSMHVPPDVLERRPAARVAAAVLVHGLVEANNRAALGASPYVPGAWWDGSADIVAAVLAMRPEHAAAVGVMVAESFFAERRERAYLERDEIERLVRTAYRVALDLRQRDPVLARRIVLGE
ncbi:MAG TPA: hypothetical protein VKA84_07265 [Gemmatimonadaceae bacterium]|nr:hypothetical protein [Gemmatimonadaceae bacterium]